MGRVGKKTEKWPDEAKKKTKHISLFWGVGGKG